MSGVDVDTRSDIYSLGVTLWFLLTGRATFEGSQFQVLSQHLQKRPPLEKLTDAGVPPEIVALLGSMLAKDREERPANHPALMATLKKILRGGGSTTAARIAAADSSPDATLAISDRSPGSSASLRPASAMPLESIAPLETAGTAKRWAIPVGVGVLAAAALAIWQPWRTANKQPLAAVDAPAPVLAASPAKVEIAPEKSVAVLAFENLSDDKSNEYFSDGISEELLTVLQKIPGLRVAARTSAFSFKGKNAKAQEIGQQLGVAQLVEGSVRKAGNSVRIAARLTRADTGEQLWSENYTRDIKDVFAVQSEIAQTILEQLRARLGGEVGTSAAKAQIQSQVKAAEKGGTTNLDAYQYFLRGRFLANQFSSESLKAAIASFRKAVAADPGFALGWAALSETLSLQVGWDATMDSPISDTMEQAREAANRALAIEPNLAEALLALAQVQVEHDFNWKGGNASVRRALELVPSSARGINLLAEIEISVGSPERAIELGAQAVALDPLNPELRLSHGWHLVDVQKFAEAEAQFRRALQINPSALAVQSELALAVLWQNRAGEALAIAESDLPGWARAYALAVIYWQQGKRAEADAALEDLKTNYSQAAAFQVAQVYAYRGEPDQAFAWIERAYVQRDSGIVGLKADHMLQSLHGDPRWAALLQKLDVPAGKSK